MLRFPTCLLVLGLLASEPLHAAEPYDLIFRTGTLSNVPTDHELVYSRAMTMPDNPQVEQAGTGLIVLSFVPDDMAELDFRQGDRHRIVGLFPVTVGNPLAMYFLETVINDISRDTGGSPYYLRNRIKESLRESAEIKELEERTDGQSIATRQITLHPFQGDRNRDQMLGYEDLAMTFTMSDDVPGWYASLVAEVPSDDTAPPFYRNALTLTDTEASQ